MKTDLATSVLAAIVGVVIGFFVCNLLVPELGNVVIKNLSGTLDYSLTEPDENVFNFRALNPTVEVYVGECTAFDADGNCIDDRTVVENEENRIDEETENNSDEQNSDNVERED